jgi:ankyrin repeat protein
MRSGDSPLHYAAREGSTEVAQLLLDRGARINEPGYMSA